MAAATNTTVEGKLAKTQSHIDPATRRRFVRRTTVYIAEYILMLILMGILLGLLTSLWYGFFNLIVKDGTAGRSLAITVAGLMGALLVVGPATYWMYARVTGEEAEHPEHTRQKARTVFLTLWLVPAVLALVSVLVTVSSSIMRGIFGVGGNASTLWVGEVLPGLFAAATIGYGIAIIVKHVTRRLVVLSGMVLAGIAAFLLLANLVMVVVRKDAQTSPSQSCTYRQYLNEQCSYREYMQNLRDNTDDSLNISPYTELFN